MNYELRGTALQQTLGNRCAEAKAGRKDLERRVLDLGRVDAALDRLVDGTFGHCTTCDQKIAIERLLQDPSIACCKACS